MTLRTYILDDDQAAVDLLKEMIHQLSPKLSVIGSSSFPAKAVAQIRQLNPDLLFLDIEMPGLSGFDVLQELSDLSIKVIFTTAYEQYAIQAIRCSAVDYLLKPIHLQRLQEAVSLAQQQIQANLYPMQDIHRLLLQQISYKKIRKIALPVKEGMMFVPVEQIIMFTARGSYTEVVVHGKTYLVTRHLREYEELMPADLFMRVHQSHLVQLEYVSRFVNRDGGFLELENGMEIEVSRRKKTAVMNRLMGRDMKDME
jgi:two-component system LytT family response regulator